MAAQKALAWDDNWQLHVREKVKSGSISLQG
jgi:hypothetical protein